MASFPAPGDVSDDAGDPPLEVAGHVQISKTAWRVSTFGLLILSAVLICGLIAQTSLANRGDAAQDPLASLALVLAILAFVVQIVMYAFQANAANAALRRGEEVNRETHGFLREIRQASRTVQRDQTRQIDKLIAYLMRDGERMASDNEGGVEARVDVSDDGHAEGPTQPAVLEESRRRALEGALREALASDGGYVADEGDAAVLRYFRTDPSRAEAEAAVRMLQKVAPMGLVLLLRYAENEIAQRQRGERVGLRATHPSEVRDRLVAEGLLASLGSNRHALTDLGRSCARLILPRNASSRPDWWVEVLAPLHGAENSS